MNAMRVPYEALEEGSAVCFGGFRLPARSPAMRDEDRPSKHVEEPQALARGGSTLMETKKAESFLTLSSLRNISTDHR